MSKRIQKVFEDAGIGTGLTAFTNLQLEQLTKRAHVIMDGRK